MNTPFYTIITPCLNAGERLNRTLDSVLAQTFADYEIIVKDAGSTDGSLENMRQDRRIRLVRGTDSGIYDGMNQSLLLANGEYLYFLNCGDVLHDEKVLETVEHEIEAYCSMTGKAAGMKPQPGRGGNADAAGDRAPQETPPAVIFYGDVIELRTGQHVAANPKMTHLAMYRNLPCHQACFYSRDLFRERGFDTQYRVRADYEHFLWCVIRQGAPAAAMPVIVADYEGGGFSETEANRMISAREHDVIAMRYFTPAELRRFRWYMRLTLQPLREKMAQSPGTAALYNSIKNRIYGRK